MSFQLPKPSTQFPPEPCASLTRILERRSNTEDHAWIAPIVLAYDELDLVTRFSTTGLLVVFKEEVVGAQTIGEPSIC